MRRFPKNGGIVMARQPKQEKQPHLAWRITRTVLDVLGKIILVLLIAVGTVALIAAIAGSIFLSKFKSYVELDIIPKAEEYAEGLELDNISLAQTSIIYYTTPRRGNTMSCSSFMARRTAFGSPMTIFPLISFMRPFPSRTSASPRTRAWTGSAHWQP